MVRKLPKILTQEEFEKIFSHTLKTKKKNRKQYALAMLLGFEAGMRISEIVGYKDKFPRLNKEMVNLEQNTIRVRGKGMGKGTDRVVPLPKRFKQPHLSLLPIKLSRRSLQWYITELGKKVLNKHITFHTLRHGFGSHLAGEGRPIHEIQMLMGHARLDTTGIYLHANPKKAIEGARDVF